MQSKKYVPSTDIPVFNIRKVNKKTIGLGKNLGEGYYYTPEAQHEKVYDFQNYSSIFQQNPQTHDPRKQKQMILDQTVNQAIINSKAYMDLKKLHIENKKKNLERKLGLQQQIEKQRNQKKQLKTERQKLQSEKKKYLEAIAAMKEKIEAVREANQRYRQALNNNCQRLANGQQADYISNLIMSMRFQAQYEHDIDPDQMTYEQLLELQQKIGHVNRGLPVEVIESILVKTEVTSQTQLNEEDKCMVCISNYEIGEVKAKLNTCKHEFHYECLQSWLGKQKICPLCKQEVLTENPQNERQLEAEQEKIAVS